MSPTVVGRAATRPVTPPAPPAAPVRAVSVWERAESWERKLKPVLYLLGAVVFGLTTYAVPKAEGWAQDVAQVVVDKAVKRHGLVHEAESAKLDSKMSELKQMLMAITEYQVAAALKAEEAAKDRAAVLCKTITKTSIRGDLCVLKRTTSRAKRTIPLVDLKALRAEVYGIE